MSEKTELEKTMQEQSEALVVVRSKMKEIKTLGVETKAGASEAKVMAQKANDALDEFEKKNQDTMLKINNERKAEMEKTAAVEKEIKALQTKIADLSINGGAGSVDPAIERQISLMKEMKSLSSFARNAKATPEQYEKLGIEHKYFQSDNDENGGFLMNESYQDRILRPVTEISPIRSIATTTVIPGLALNLYIEAQDFEAFWTAEGQTPFTESNQKFQQPRIPLHGITVKTRTTNKAAMGSKFSFDNMVGSGFQRVRLKKEGAAYVNGDGVDKPTGFMNAKAGLTSVETATASTLTYEDLVLLTGELKEGYDAQYLFNRKTLSKIRVLTTPTGEYIWAPGNLGAGVPNMIAGESYTLVPDMANIADGAEPIAFGDFLQGFQIIDASMANFLRNPYKEDGFVAYTLEGYTGSDVTLKEAMVKLKIKSA